MIFVNFKTYASGTGERARELVWDLEKVAKETGVEVIPVVQLVDLQMLADVSNLDIWVQHADGISAGAHTGAVLPEAVKEAGAVGVLLNHSERKFSVKNPKSEVRSTKQLQDSNFQNSKQEDSGLGVAVERCREVGLKVLICADGVDEVKQVLELKPDFLAYEPPELIGSSEVSVVSKPEVVAEVVELAAGVPVIIGAGVHTVEDIRKGLELGAKGFLISSAIMKAEDPEEKLRELVAGYK
jgi:triosephosphate isomerase